MRTYPEEAPLCRASIRLAQVDGWNQALRACVELISARQHPMLARELAREIEQIREPTDPCDVALAQDQYGREEASREVNA